MVNIYITTTAKGPRIWKTAYYVYTMEYNGHTRNHSGRMKNCTENQLEINIIAEALGRLNKMQKVRIFTGCTHVLNTVNNHWIAQWEKNGWKKSGNRPVKNQELWQQITELMRYHVVTFTDEAHEYSLWHQFCIEKLKEKHNEEQKHFTADKRVLPVPRES